MDFQTIAQNMYPYWILGALTIAAVIAAGKKELVRVESKPLINWCIFLVFITIVRVILVKFAESQGATMPANAIRIIPWAASFTVFWEDAAHGMPLLILRMLLPKNRWYSKLIYFAALSMVMCSFGVGHVYQGLGVACLLSFYIPYSIRCGRKYGFGTVMLCHTLYDLVTMLFAQYFM